MCQSITASYM